MKLKDLFGSLFRSWKKPVGTAAFDKDFMETCVGSEPEDLRALVIAEQRNLEAEVEDSVATLRSEMRRLAERVNEMSPKKVEQEVAALRSAQDDLRRLIRRCAVSAKRTQELERELDLWQKRLDEAGDIHADHPRVRAEIIRSELAARGIESSVHTLPAVAVEALHDIDEALGQRAVSQANERSDRSDDIMKFSSHPDTKYLVQAIREATHEAELWHAYHSDDANAYMDAVDQVRHLRDLHAALKSVDRSVGVTRDRIAIAVRMNDE